MTHSNANLYAAMHTQFVQHSDKVLLFNEDGNSYTYADIDTESARLANFITNLGLLPGERVSVQVEKSPQALCLYLACLRAGFVFHPLNTAYKVSELDYFLNNAKPAIVVCDSSKESDISPIAHSANVGHLFTLDADGSGSLITQSRHASTDFACISRSKDDLAALLYSSGTTGVPKGIMLTHGNLLSNSQTLIECWGFTEKDCLLHTLPIFHVHGLFVALGCVLLSGANMRWMKAFNDDKIIKYLPTCTVMMGVPTYYTRLLDNKNFTTHTCATIRLFISGSAPLLKETFIDFEKRTGHQILERYGMTETNMNTSNPLHGTRKLGTVGIPLPNIDIRIVDENNKILSTNETGNLQVRGPNVFKGYWEMPKKTANDFTTDNFFNTGDQAYIDKDGYITIVGRTKDLIITGGINVYPKELELLIDEIPTIKESAVIGVPHPDFGEAVVAVIIRDPVTTSTTEVDILATLKKQLANFKIPKKIIYTDTLPRNTMGKVQKNILREDNKHLFQKVKR